MIFQDRFEAGKLLARKLAAYKNRKDTILLAIPRGALQLGSVLAKELQLPLDIVLTKKIPAPDNPEAAIGAVSLRGELLDEELIHLEGISEEYVASQAKELRQKLKERAALYLGKRKPLSLQGKIVIIVDDGVAMGSTMLAAIAFVRQERPKKIIVAIPVGSAEALAKLREKADGVICLHTPEFFYALGAFYREFPQVEDEEAIKLLRKANERKRRC
ncbi:MAG: phosphoribosyltransferase family protein [Nanoarchaeota archaeon]|nr:phosphoribosyltransferase family protein [Nanoarchaeota archaeon]